jgi:uncharacterized integral membrane protein
MRFIGRFFWVIISLGTIVLAMVFAASNNHMVIVKLWPLAGQLELAIWMLTLGAICAGAVIGGGLVWLSLVAARSRNWRLKRQLGKAEQRANTAEARLAEMEQGKTTTPPVLGGPS